VRITTVGSMQYAILITISEDSCIHREEGQDRIYYSTAQYINVQYCTVLYINGQDCTVLPSTLMYSTV